MKCSSIFLKIHAAPSILIFFRPFFLYFFLSIGGSSLSLPCSSFSSSSLLHLGGLELMTWKYREISTDHFINWAMWTYQLIKHIFGNHMNLVWLRDLEKKWLQIGTVQPYHALFELYLNYFFLKLILGT